MLFWSRAKKNCCVCGLSILLVACSAPSPTPMRTTQASVSFSSQNSQAIALAPFYLVPQKPESDHAWSLTLKAAEDKPIAGLLKPNQMLIDAVTASLKKLSAHGVRRFQQNGCRGQFQARSLPSTADGFAGRIEFNDYADNCTLTLDGAVSFKADALSVANMTAVLNTEQLSAKIAENQYQVTGLLEFSFNSQSGSGDYVALSNLSLISSTAQRFDLHDVQIVRSPQQDSYQLSLDGRINFSRHGGVKVVTDSPLLVEEITGLPFDGMLTFHGANAGWVRIFFPKAAYPGFFRLDGSDGLQTMGKL